MCIYLDHRILIPNNSTQHIGHSDIRHLQGLGPSFSVRVSRVSRVSVLELWLARHVGVLQS